MKHALSVFAIAAAAFFAVPGQAEVIRFTADLSGLNEAPPNASPGTGDVSAFYDNVAHTLEIHAIFSGLLGTTTAAHIHCCTPVPGVPPVSVATTTPSFVGFPLGVSSGVFDTLLDLTAASSYRPGFLANEGGGTTAGAEAALTNGMIAGRAYFNIHSNVFPGGEILGFLQVPEPTTLSLLALGLAGGLLGLRRRRPN